VTQVLEGPEDNVRALFNRIAADYRHVDCEVLSEGRVGKRLHPDFGMAVAKVAYEEQMALRRAGRAIRPPRSVKSFDFVRLQYSSFLLAPEGAAQAREILSSILEASVHNNATLKIGGLLCFNPDTLEVVQMLEGPTRAVQSLYKKIEADPRHTDVQLTSEEVLLSPAERHFEASWGMLQTESQVASLLDLSSRLQHAYETHDVDTTDLAELGLAHVMSFEDKMSTAAQADGRQRIIDEAVKDPVDDAIVGMAGESGWHGRRLTMLS